MTGDYEITCPVGSCGVLHVYNEGLYTVFEAKCLYVDDIRRIVVSDGENTLALGVLIPENGYSTMKRKFSAAALKSTGLKLIKRAYIRGEADPENEVSGQGGSGNIERPVYGGASCDVNDRDRAGDDSFLSGPAGKNPVPLKDREEQLRTVDADGAGEGIFENDREEEAADNSPDTATEVPMNIGGRFSRPDHFFDLELIEREDGLYGVL
jgi:hypothetical protein